VRFEYDKVAALLSYVMVESASPISRQRLAGLLWPEVSDRVARQDLSQALYTLRKTIGDYAAVPAYLLITPQAIQFNVKSDHYLDVRDLRDSVRISRGHGHPATPVCSECMDRLEAAVALYRGEFLEGFSLPDSPDFEEWLTLQRERLQYQVLEELDALTDALIVRRGYKRALTYARRQLSLDSWRESAHRQVMRALAMMGERSAALAHYDHCRQVLKEGLDVEPELLTERLFQQIKTGDIDDGRLHVGAPASAPRQNVFFCDGVRSAQNLPAQLTPIVGRDDEIAEIRRLLRHSSYRLLTLLGPGGIGKTRLALEVARGLMTEFESVCYVPLNQVSTQAGLTAAIARSLDMPVSDMEELTVRQLFTCLAETSALLVLDGFEDLLDSVPLIDEILKTCPQLRIVVTSRISLGFWGEYIYRVSPLPVPEEFDNSTETVSSLPSMQLFALTSRLSMPSFRLSQENLAAVGRICRLVYGYPLAIILAAAWITVLTPAEIAERIAARERRSSSLRPEGLDFLVTDWQGLADRHRSMRTVVEQTWRSLTMREQATLKSVAALSDEICYDSVGTLDGVSIYDLRSLAQKSLIQRMADGTYALPPLLRQYVLDLPVGEEACPATAVSR
jgi:predicted ATPase